MIITLGQASNYSFGRVWRHLLAFGSQKSSQNLRQALAKRYQVQPENIALYHTGRSALTAALHSVAANQKTAVIIPGLTCIAVVRAVKAAGCDPVFVDILPENLSYNSEKLRKTLKTLAKNEKVCYNRIIVLVQNTLGITCDVSAIEKLASEFHALIVEDLAHSAGRFYPDGREVGTIGAAAALSFGKGKALDTISGGAVILHNHQTAVQPSRRPKLSDRLRDRWYPLLGWLSRATWQIGLGKILMAGLVKIHWVQRSADAELDLSHRLTHWQAKLANRQLANLPKTPLRDHTFVRDREKLLSELHQSGYNLDEIWYDAPVSPPRYAKEANFPVSDCPETVKISRAIINLPTWYPTAKLSKAKTIIKKYEVEL